MFDRIGIKSFEELLASIPDKLRLNRPLDIEPLSEMELLSQIEAMSNRNAKDVACFAGGGVYEHFVPAALGALLSRPEFVTAYTPYQAEVAQGTLQAIYEFQTHICRLTGMDVSNASMYDGATAAAEAVIISTAVTRRNKVVVCETVNPLYREVIQTYLTARDTEIVTAPASEGGVNLDKLADLVDDRTACVLIAQPNFFGLLEDIERVAALTERCGAKLIMSVDPIAQAVLKTPAEYGADMVVGEGQPLGIPLSFGGPLLGFFAARKELIRSLPGRIAARTVDLEGKPGFVLTLQTREQHIRREKATSNICTNQALCATAAAIYCSLMGKDGLKQVALLSAEKAQKLARRIASLDGYEIYFERPFVREFAVRLPVPATELIMKMIEKKKVLPGVDAGRWFGGMENCLVVAVTELRTEADMDKLIDGLKEFSASGVLSEM